MADHCDQCNGVADRKRQDQLAHVMVKRTTLTGVAGHHHGVCGYVDLCLSVSVSAAWVVVSAG